MVNLFIDNVLDVRKSVAVQVPRGTFHVTLDYFGEGMPETEWKFFSDCHCREICRPTVVNENGPWQLCEYGPWEFRILRDGKVICELIASENRWLIEGDSAHQFYSPDRAFDFVTGTNF